jgi:hypothetical protein
MTGKWKLRVRHCAFAGDFPLNVGNFWGLAASDMAKVWVDKNQSQNGEE